MAAARWSELKEAFGTLSDLPPRERALRLELLAVTDPELHRDLSRLLQADAHAAELLSDLEPSRVVGPGGAAPVDPTGLVGTTVSHFRILDVLGMGGMGVVYRARDEQLGRTVALKFLLPQYALMPVARERFIREACAASTLEHPNICTVYEAGVAANGAAFIAMACYDGATLREAACDGALPVGDAVDIAVQVLRGLGAAHTAGIVHRDLKPANVFMASDGIVRILDFGLARATDVRDLTGPGLPPGTVAYMSPEQLAGDDVDQRTDLWSVGIVLYEMLTGRAPFRRGHELSTVHAILHDAPARPSALRAEVPAWLDAVVLRLLEKNPADRYASAADVLAQLSASAAPAPRRLRNSRRAAIATAAALVLVAVFAGALVRDARTVQRAPGAGAVETDINSIAVLPFADLSPRRDQEHFSAGVAEEILNALHGLGTLRVTPRASAHAFRDSELAPAQVAQRLGVRFVLSGAVRRNGPDVHIAARLLDAASGRELWARTFDSPLDKVATVQTEIARAAAVALEVQSSGVGSMASSTTRSADGAGHELYLFGLMHLHRRTPHDLTRAAHYFEQSITRDPANARAFAGLALAHAVLPLLLGESAADAVPRVEAAAARAHTLDPLLADPYAALGYVYHQAWRWDDAERAFRRALELDPHHASALQWYGEHTVKMGAAAEAEAMLRRAVALDPLSINAHNNLGLVLLCAGRTEAAIIQFERTLDMDPGFTIAHLLLFRARVLAGDLDGALESRNVYDRLTGQNPDEMERVIRAIQGRGDGAGARAMLDGWVRQPSRLGDVVLLAPLLGESDRALDMLEHALQWRHPLLASLGTDAWAVALHAEPRYQRIVRQLNFPETRAALPQYVPQ